MSEERATVYVTTWALTMGILVWRDAEISGSLATEPRAEVKSGWYVRHAHGEGKNWHRTREGASLRAAKMIEARTNALRKALQKLAGLNVKFVEPASEASE